MTLTCEDDSSLTSSYAFDVSFTPAPTAAPTIAPTAAPTADPSAAPTIAPTSAPTAAPTAAPTIAPTSSPSPRPSALPTARPSALPSPRRAAAEPLPTAADAAAEPAADGAADAVADGDPYRFPGADGGAVRVRAAAPAIAAAALVVARDHRRGADAPSDRGGRGGGEAFPCGGVVDVPGPTESCAFSGEAAVTAGSCGDLELDAAADRGRRRPLACVVRDGRARRRGRGRDGRDARRRRGGPRRRRGDDGGRRGGGDELLGETPAATASVRVRGEAIPTVAISGGARRELRRSEPLEVFASAEACAAAGLDSAALDYAWAWDRAGWPASRSLNPRSFSLEAYDAPADAPGSSATLAVTVTDASGVAARASVELAFVGPTSPPSCAGRRQRRGGGGDGPPRRVRVRRPGRRRRRRRRRGVELRRRRRALRLRRRAGPVASSRASRWRLRLRGDGDGARRPVRDVRARRRARRRGPRALRVRRRRRGGDRSTRRWRHGDAADPAAAAPWTGPGPRAVFDGAADLAAAAAVATRGAAAAPGDVVLKLGAGVPWRRRRALELARFADGSGAAASSTVALAVNAPPSGGSVAVAPAAGEALATAFAIRGGLGRRRWRRPAPLRRRAYRAPGAGARPNVLATDLLEPELRGVVLPQGDEPDGYGVVAVRCRDAPRRSAEPRDDDRRRAVGHGRGGARRLRRGPARGGAGDDEHRGGPRGDPRRRAHAAGDRARRRRRRLDDAGCANGVAAGDACACDAGWHGPACDVDADDWAATTALTAASPAATMETQTPNGAAALQQSSTLAALGSDAVDSLDADGREGALSAARTVSVVAENTPATGERGGATSLNVVGTLSSLIGAGVFPPANATANGTSPRAAAARAQRARRRARRKAKPGPGGASLAPATPPAAARTATSSTPSTPSRSAASAARPRRTHLRRRRQRHGALAALAADDDYAFDDDAFLAELAAATAGAVEVNCSSAATARCDRDAASSRRSCDAAAVTAENTTCRCAAALAEEPADYGSAADVATSYFASAFKAGATTQVITQNLLLMYTYATMAGICALVALWGGADARDAAGAAAARAAHAARLATTTPGERLVGVAPGTPVDAADAHLALVHASLPASATVLVERPYRYCARLLWKKHSWLKAVMFWFAFPTGICDPDEPLGRDECLQMESIFGDGGKMCMFIDPPEVVEPGLDRCQLAPPGSAAITMRRVVLIFAACAIALPCQFLFELVFIRYACAPLKKAGDDDDDGEAYEDEDEARERREDGGLRVAGDVLLHRLGCRDPLTDDGDGDEGNALLSKKTLEVVLDAIDALDYHDRRERADLEWLLRKLERRWRCHPSARDWKEAFVAKTARVLETNMRVAAQWNARLAAVDDPAVKCRLCYQLLRYELLGKFERKIFELELAADGSFSDPHATPKPIAPPVTRFQRWVLGYGVTAFAFAYPSYFLLIFGLQQGKKMTLAWWWFTMFFIFFNVFTVEPLRIFLMRVTLPSFITPKVLQAFDPTRFRLHFRTPLSVEASDLLDPDELALAFKGGGDFARLPGRLRAVAGHRAYLDERRPVGAARRRAPRRGSSSRR
ncbi:hypothetical protein JL720_13210 [Aureococcus anophagefferens]|nr:hypothetical protein JL720_13210 [Aureococcus anophagefferens]